MNSFHDGDVYPVDVRDRFNALYNPSVYLSDLTFYSDQYDPASLQYMLEFFRNVAQTIPSSSPSPTSTAPDSNETHAPSSVGPVAGSARDMLQDRAGIIVLREDLDFYAIPPRAEIEQPEMIEVKRAAGKALLRQDGIFSGLRRSEETGTTEQHLIEMLTAGYVSTSVALPPVNLRSPLLTNVGFDRVAVSTTTTGGAIEQTNPTKPSSAVSHSPDYAPISKAPNWQTATRWAWRRSCCSSGGNRPGGVGGRGWSWKTSRAWRGS